MSTDPPAETNRQAAAAWVLGPEQALDSEVVGWRLTIDAGSTGHEHVLDAAARTKAAFLRSPRSRVADLARIASLPGISTSISVFVDDIDQAACRDRSRVPPTSCLRDWDNERPGRAPRGDASRHADRKDRFSRGPTPTPGPVPGIDELRIALPRHLFTAWLHQVDGSGAVRPRVEWAPGKNLAVPVPPARISAQWTDPIWVAGSAPSELNGAR